MNELKKHDDFENLKSEIKVQSPLPKDGKLLLEFKDFLHSLRQQFLNSQHLKSTYEKRLN